MEWLKKNYDRVILLLAALITGGLAISFIVKAVNFGENFLITAVTPKNELPENPQVDVGIATDTLALISLWAPPTLPDEKQPSLFVSVPIVEKDGEIFNMFEEGKLLREPVSNKWLIGNALEFLRADVLELDPDGDFFSNLQEWEAKTEPDDEKDHPSFLKKLVLLQRTQEDYIISFVADNDPSFQIQRITPNPQTVFKKAGETFFDDRFKLEGYEKLTANVGGIDRNVSVLTVTDLETSKQLKLIFRERLNLPTYFAEFQYTLGDPEKITVKEGETFKLPSGDPTIYKLIEVQEVEATIQSVPPLGTADQPASHVIKKPGA